MYIHKRTQDVRGYVKCVRPCTHLTPSFLRDKNTQSPKMYKDVHTPTGKDAGVSSLESFRRKSKTLR